jgi:hypothetical protein
MQSPPVGLAVAAVPSAQSEQPLAPDLVVGATRGRQTVRPTNPFRDVLAGGVGLLMRGAEVATTVVGSPIMAVAVREARTNAVAVVGGAPPSGSVGASTGGAASGLSPSTGGDATELASVQAMQRDSQVFNLQLLQLQEDVQQENQRFTTVSNVLRAKHDTAKAAVSNIRS